MTLRDMIRSGLLDPDTYRSVTESIYHQERRAEGLEDGEQFWYVVPVQPDAGIR